MNVGKLIQKLKELQLKLDDTQEIEVRIAILGDDDYPIEDVETENGYVFIIPSEER